MRPNYIQRTDLFDQDGPVLPVCLCLDTSRSMQATIGGTLTGEHVMIGGTRYPVVVGGVARIETLQAGIEQFYSSIYTDELARYTVELAIVTFDDQSHCTRKFSSLVKNGHPSVPPVLTPRGESTHLGKAINHALDLLEKRKAFHKKKGHDVYQPWLIIMTDGKDRGDPDELKRAIHRIHTSVQNKKLGVYPFAIGRSANLEQLNALSPVQEAFRLEETQMKGLFTWFARSASKVSSGEIDPYSSPKLEEYEVVSWKKDL